MSNKIKLIIAALIAGAFAVGLLSSVVIAEILKTAGDAEFCGSCHSMEPMKAAYEKQFHGGNNKAGFRAPCEACHLPHDSVLKHVVVKGMNGLSDTLSEKFGGPIPLQHWVERAEHRTEFVYDSGCLECHSDIKNSKMPANIKAIHNDYFAKRDTNKFYRCGNCHEDVGHGDMVEKMREQVAAQATAKK